MDILYRMGQIIGRRKVGERRANYVVKPAIKIQRRKVNRMKKGGYLKNLQKTRGYFRGLGTL